MTEAEAQAVREAQEEMGLLALELLDKAGWKLDYSSLKSAHTIVIAGLPYLHDTCPRYIVEFTVEEQGEDVLLVATLGSIV